MDTNLLDCGHAPSKSIYPTTGYGIDKNGKKLCYACCADNEREYMKREGRIALYLSEEKKGSHVEYMVTNWSDVLSFLPFRVRDGRHNIAGTRTDVWFTGPDGVPWHGVQYGCNTQICHCKRIKA